MLDEEIIDLYWQRSERAIIETANKYGNYCFVVANSVLHNASDSEECVNDAYFATWNTIPPQRPHRFQGFLGKITRNIALNRYKRENAWRRRNKFGPDMALHELQECIPSIKSTEEIVEDERLGEVMNRFVAELSSDVRRIFMQRYWYMFDIKQIARENRMSEGNVYTALFRLRVKLKEFLEEEGIVL